MSWTAQPQTLWIAVSFLTYLWPEPPNLSTDTHKHNLPRSVAEVLFTVHRLSFPFFPQPYANSRMWDMQHWNGVGWYSSKSACVAGLENQRNKRFTTKRQLNVCRRLTGRWSKMTMGKDVIFLLVPRWYREHTLKKQNKYDFQACRAFLFLLWPSWLCSPVRVVFKSGEGLNVIKVMWMSVCYKRIQTVYCTEIWTIKVRSHVAVWFEWIDSLTEGNWKYRLCFFILLTH